MGDRPFVTRWHVTALCRAVVLTLITAAVSHGQTSDVPQTLSQSLIINGRAEAVNPAGDLQDWSVYVRKGAATLTPATDEKVEGQRSAQLEIGREGANYTVQTGRINLPVRNTDAAYRFTAQVKSVVEKGRNASGYFCLGAGGELSIGRFVGNAGWQEVQLDIVVPANQSLRRLDFNGGSDGPATFHIDNIQLRPLEAHEAQELIFKPNPLESAIALEPGVPMLVRKVPPADVRLVRGFSHAPVDGRPDTGHAGVNYNMFNGNNGLHIILDHGAFNALQIRGGWKGRLYADCDLLTPPDASTHPLAEIRSRSGVFRRVFESAVEARKLSFFHNPNDPDNVYPLAEITFLSFERAAKFGGDDEPISYALAGTIAVDDIFAQAIRQRYGDNNLVHGLKHGAATDVTLSKGRHLHMFTPPQRPDAGIAAVTLQFHVNQVEPGTVLTLLVQDVLDVRRECMGVDVQLPGPGSYTVTLDTPDQVFLPPPQRWTRPPRLDGLIAPPPQLWLSIAAESSVELRDVTVRVHAVSRDTAMLQAGPWRTLLLRGLFSNLSEPRPWMHLNDKSPVRQQIDNNPTIARQRVPLLMELLETVEVARLLMPDDDVVRQYHDWIYQMLDRDKPPPAFALPQVEGAPTWAVLIRQNWREIEHIAQWWLDNRLVPNGELGGHPGDDTDMFQTWQCLPMIESDPLGARLKDAAAKLADLAWEWKLDEGINKRTTDALHAYEEGINQLALCAWWFYGDPVHYERAMISARSVLGLMVRTDDGRLHFGSNYVGIDELRHGYKTLGKTAGDGSWCPIRLMLHPVYVAALYNRHPALIEKLGQWGQTWRDYQHPGAYVGQVDIATGKPTVVSKLPSAAAIGPIDEWLALYHITGDRKWQEPFEFMMDSGGYWGTSVQYGRSAHAMVDWKEPYQQRMRDKWNGEDTGYAGFFLSKDRSKLEKWLMNSAAWYGRYRHMHTAAEQKTDRVLTYNATVPISCYLGDAPNRNRWLNFTAVSYEGLRGEDFAALVWDAAGDKLRVAIYNFSHKPLSGTIRTWRLDHGRFRLRIGADTDDDGSIDSVSEDREVQLMRGSRIAVTLPPKQVTVVNVEQIEQLDDIRTRADLALSQRHTVVAGSSVSGIVHNIGSASADVTVAVLDAAGKVLVQQSLGKLDAPLDLKPRHLPFTLQVPGGVKPGHRLVVDPAGSVPEIYEENNSVLLLSGKNLQ